MKDSLSYTSVIQKPLETISWEDDNFIEELLQVVQLFRPFSVAITEFIVDHGYSGEASDVEAKVAFIRSAFAAGNMDAPREIREWFTVGQPIKRDTAFLICFAFGLDGNETDEFFRRYYARERSFNCHQVQEAIYYFCLNNGLSYAEALDIQTRVPLAGENRKGGDVVYTGSIIAELNDLETKEELISYLTENIDKFSDSNVTAYETIRRLWERSAGPNGLLLEERKSLPSMLDDAASGKKTILRSGEAGVRPWDAYLAIFQLDKKTVGKLETDRTIKPIIEKLHADAQDSFPDRQGIDLILHGKHVSYERVRKWLVLLTFYTFWARKAVDMGAYEAQPSDASRCISHMNQVLMDAGYLDLKPDNILTVEGSHDLVQLFDFDSMISMETLAEAIKLNDPNGLRTSYSRGYAPLEQQTGKLKQLGKHTDIYSLGAVLFFALWHRTPTAFDCEQDAVFDFASIAYPCKNYQDRLFHALTEFFHKTLASYHMDRYQDTSDVIMQLQKMLSLADETKPWLHSTSIQSIPAFYGREAEMCDLSQFLSENDHHTCSLYGMGGIGKSTLIRHYLSEHADDWDAHLWLYDKGNLMETLADDSQVLINTVTRENEETTDEYLKRKLVALGSLAKTQHILVVIDNFTYEHIDQLEPLSKLCMTILLISRERLPEGLFPSMQVAEMEDNSLAGMFTYYSHCDLTDEDNFSCFQTIISIIDRHTLLTELIARQVAKSYLNLQVAEAMVAGIGLSDLPNEKIDYVRDQSAYHETLLRILDRLVEIDQFTEQDKLCMKLLSLFDMPGIEADLFKWMASLTSLDFVNDLETAGWLKAEQGRLYLHPMMQEYVRTWSWDKSSIEAADRMMQMLYERIRPAGTRHDGSKQFPKDYSSLYRLLKAADQLINHTEWISEASQRLLFRMLMDAPVDQDASVLFRMLDLLKDPRYLDDDSILRLYENAAYFRARLYAPEDAIRILDEMKRYLLRHPSAYYLSAYHRAMAVILHNADEYGNLKKCLQHEDKAIAAVRLSSHPDAKKQLAASLLDKATTLLSADLDRKQARKLIMEAKPLVEQYAKATDYEKYQYACIAAMCFAMDGELAQAEEHLKAADDIAFSSPDSDLAIAEHLIEQVAPIRIAMEMNKEAADVVLQAIALCEQHPDAIRYKETRFDAYLFLGRIYAMGGEYIKGEEAFAEAEKHVADSPYEWKLPLCPEDIREKAEEERKRQE